MRVRNALVSVEGVAEVRLSLLPPVCDVLYDGDRVVTEQLVTAVAEAGQGNHHEYRAKPLL
jgi:copper chaperone CopZ